MKRMLIILALVIGFSAASSVAKAGDGGAIGFLEKTNLTGTLATSYNFNFNRPNPAAGTNDNVMRVFDPNANEFSINMAELQIENAPNDWSKFRLDIAVGEDAPLFKSAGFLAGNEFDIWQAYGELTAPIGNGLTFKVGKFATIIGAEVIESADNYNTSRSILFGFAIPFNHTGVLMSYDFSDKVSGSVGVVNGWDIVAENNKAKTFLGSLGFTINDQWSLSINGSFGAEQAGADGNFRGLVDTILTWTPSEDTAVILNYDLGKEEGVGGAGFVNWHGGSLVLHHTVNDWFGASLRGEFFDDDGSRNNAGVVNTIFGEGTLTGHFYLSDGWETRLEVRHDQANNAAFIRNNGTARKFQDTASLELLYRF
jgi:hypothetical protein